MMSTDHVALKWHPFGDKYTPGSQFCAQLVIAIKLFLLIIFKCNVFHRVLFFIQDTLIVSCIT